MKAFLAIVERPSLKHLVQLGLSLGLVFGSIAPLAAKGPGAVVRPDPPSLDVGQGQLETLNIVLENAQEVYGIEVRASFDPAVVEVVDADPGVDGVQMTPGDFIQPDFLVRNTADNQAGRLQYVITQVNPSPPASGTGVVLSIQLRGKAPGEQSLFAIDFVEIADRRGVKLDVQPHSGTINVVAPEAAGPARLFLPAIYAGYAPASQALAYPFIRVGPSRCAECRQVHLRFPSSARSRVALTRRGGPLE